MEKTQYYNLNKPEETDPLRLEDFNENADLIDAALNELNSVMGQMAVPKIAVGTYTGNGSASAKTITVGFAPKMVLVWGDWSDDYSTYHAGYCGISIQGQTLQGILTLTDTGFQVKSTKDNSNNQLYPHLNASRSYFYFAIG